MPRELHIQGHIVAVVNLRAQDGTPFCHLLLDDDAGGQAVVDGLQSAAVISDTDDEAKAFADAPAKYKRQGGEPLHQYAGSDVRRVPPIEEP